MYSGYFYKKKGEEYANGPSGKQAIYDCSVTIYEEKNKERCSQRINQYKPNTLLIMDKIFKIPTFI